MGSFANLIVSQNSGQIGGGQGNINQGGKQQQGVINQQKGMTSNQQQN